MSQSRQLAAIMFTDIVGYTALMGNDEQKAFEILRKNRELQKPIVEQFNGSWIKEIGDGVLASFSTVSDALNAAIRIQEACKATNDFQLRIGIHEGEVVFETDDIFGDAVNIASRIQTLAVPGAILFSKKVMDEIRNKGEFHTVSLGTFDFKNVNEPIEVFALANDGFPVPKRSMMVGKLKQKNIQIRNVVAALCLFLFVIAAFFIYKKIYPRNDKSGIDKSIAVLPFVDMSPGKDQEYFSDGLSEELLNLLSKIPELKVIGRTSSFSFKGKNEDLRIIGQKLGAANILEGSVQKDGNSIRVTAQLIRVADGYHLWSDRYDRDLGDIFKLQDEIAEAVVKQLRLKLLAVPKREKDQPGIEVHNLLLQGNYFLDKLDKENVAKAVDFFHQGLIIDSTEGRLWAAIATATSRQAWQNYIDQFQGYETARAAAIRAISIDSTLTEGHLELGVIKMYHDFDWLGADLELQKAHSLEPGNSAVLWNMSVLAGILGDWEKALQLNKQALALDPLKPILYSDQGAYLTYINHLDEAILQYSKILELNPLFQRAHLYLGRIYLLQNHPEKALIEMQKENMEIFKRFGLSLAYHALGRKKEADKELGDFISDYQYRWTYLIAEIYAFRKEKDRAFGWLDSAYQKRDSWLIWLKGDPLLKNLEGDPRHSAFLKKMKLSID